MIKSRIVQAAAVTLSTVGLVAGYSGIVGASAGTGVIGTTGPFSYNKVSTHNSAHTSLTNDNNLHLASMNMQGAGTGAVYVNDNTTAGGAMSGSAANNSATMATVTVTNTSGADLMGATDPSTGSGTVTNTGPHSTNVVTTTNHNDVTVKNQNDVSVMTTNTQSANSGNVTVTDNTTGGNAVSGNATNTSTSSFSLNISN